MKTLLLKFAGPMQSWGTSSHFETRHTDLYPSKSAVIGLLAASLGYRRAEDENIQALNNLDFAVRIDQPGYLLRDYHIAAKYKDNGDFERNYVTNRFYLEDAVFTIGIGCDDDDFIDELVEAILNPYFQPYLGRRSAPLTYDFFLGVEEADVIESLKELPWQASEWYQRKSSGKQKFVIYADASLLPECVSHYRKDDVVSFDQKSREYEYRMEARQTLEAINPNQLEEHDAFEALGD